jgi:hypothetical protein
MEFTPEVALAIFFAKLIDPIAVLPAVVCTENFIRID